MNQTLRKLLAIGALALSGSIALASTNGLVISQVYGGGGNSGSTYKNDFIEVFNAGAVAVDLTGYTVQYSSATGTTWAATPLSGILAVGQYYLVQEAVGAGGTTNLPMPDATGTLALSATTGKVALTNSTTLLSGATPTSTAIVDLLGYGAASAYEGSAPASGLSNTLAALRVNVGCTDTNVNSADFTAGAPLPRNTATALVDCTSYTPPPPVDPAPVAARIHDIQGRAHRSPLEGRKVAGTPGIVTAIRSTGFYMEDPLPDNDPMTSEGIFVYTVTTPTTVTVGQYVLVSGTVTEFRPGGSSGSGNLTTTEIDSPTIVAGGSAPAPLPAPIVIGSGGRVPPTAKFASATVSGSVEAADYVFDAVNNGIDFYESLESMRVVVNNAVVVGPTDVNDETPILGDNGSLATGRSARGGIVITATDYNPERIIIGDTLLAAGTMPKSNVGDLLSPITGIVDYSFGNFKLLVTSVPSRVAGPIAQEVTPLIGDAAHLTVGSFNVENLAPSDGAVKFNALAAEIVNNLHSPDILGVMEIQDNNGATSGTVVDASVTIQMLTDAVSGAGGPAYSYRQINPVADQDGGAPGGNIRQIFLFNPLRVSFTDRPTAAPSTTAVTAVPLSPGVRLSASPGRIDPSNTAWAASRKPLVGEFVFFGRTFFIVANHFNSKGGDTDLFGRFQPPQLVSEPQRINQATLVANFVTSLRAADPTAVVIVLGDLNDFEFSNPLLVLKNSGLADMIETLPANERYTYVYAGNSQVLDHILVTPNIQSLTEYDVVHVNSEFFAQISDHEPEVSRIKLGRIEYTAQLSANVTGLLLNRATGLYGGTITLTNRSTQAITGPLLVSLSGLTPTVVLQNSVGNVLGMPSIALSSGLAAGASATVPVLFANPNRAAVTYGLRVYEGPF